MQAGEWDALYAMTGLALRTIWDSPCDHQFAMGMTQLTAAIWQALRTGEDFPNSEDLANHLVGVGPDQPREFVDRILSYRAEQRRVN